MSERRPLLPVIETEAALAVGSLALFGAALYIVMFRLIPPENEKYVMLLLGSLIGIVKDTFARYFNVTKGAAEQRKTISDLATAASATATLAAVPLTTKTDTTTTATTTAGDGLAVRDAEGKAP